MVCGTLCVVCSIKLCFIANSIIIPKATRVISLQGAASLLRYRTVETLSAFFEEIFGPGVWLMVIAVLKDEGHFFFVSCRDLMQDA